jgi:tripartite ATP-independent transporter DctP family solute receptor
MKRGFTFLLAFVIFVPLLLSPSGNLSAQTATAPQKSFTLKLAGIKTVDDPASQAMELFAKEVNSNTAANIKVTTYPNSVLGSLNDMLSGMSMGTADLLYNTFSCYAWLEAAKRFTIISAPFLWKSNQELQSFLDSDVAQKWMEEAAAKSGVRVLVAQGELPPRQLTSNKPVYSATDFKGLKIRTAESPLIQSIFKKLGATPVVIPFADLYMALRQGTADAQENNFITDKNSSFYEVQKYYMKTDYSRDVSAIFISENVWKQMSPTQKAVLKKAAINAVNFEATMIANQMNQVMAFLDEHMTRINIDVKSIQDKLGTDIYKQFDDEGKIWPTGTLDAVLKFKNQ